MLTLDLVPTPEAVPQARRALDMFRRSMTPRSFEDARLMMSEVVGNGVRHGTISEGEGIGVTAALSEGILRVEVRDSGPGFTPHPRTPASDDHAQWGLYLVAQLADRWGASATPPTVVWFELEVDR